MGLKPVPSLPRAIYARQTINAVEGIEHLPDKFQPAVNFYTQFKSLTKPPTFAVETVTCPKRKGDGTCCCTPGCLFPLLLLHSQTISLTGCKTYLMGSASKRATAHTHIHYYM